MMWRDVACVRREAIYRDSAGDVQLCTKLKSLNSHINDCLKKPKPCAEFCSIGVEVGAQCLHVVTHECLACGQLVSSCRLFAILVVAACCAWLLAPLQEFYACPACQGVSEQVQRTYLSRVQSLRAEIDRMSRNPAVGIAQLNERKKQTLDVLADVEVRALTHCVHEHV